MEYLVLKSALSGSIIAVVSEVAKRQPGFGGLIASLPLLSILAVIWMWRETGDPARIADHLQATFWYVLPSLPMFLIMPAMLRQGVGFWLSLGVACAITVALYAVMVRIY